MPRDGNGIVLHESTHNTVSRNIVSNAWWGIQTCTYTDENMIAGNLVTNNEIGFWICCSPGPDLIYHNNFVENAANAVVDAVMNETAWDDGYPAGRNYWDDYEGTDEFSGPEQDIPGADGIGDSPYSLSDSHEDGYPLMNPWSDAAPHFREAVGE